MFTTDLSKQIPRLKHLNMDSVETARFDKKFVCVRFPGLVNDENKAIDSLGGAKEMAQVHADKSRLQLRFRKDDPYSKPACSTTSSCYGVLLKIRVKKRKNSTAEPQVLSTEVLGIVDTMYTFENLADFQYLPIADESNEETTSSLEKNLLNVLQPKGIVGNEWLYSEQPYFLAPSLFSRIDCPQKYLYRASTNKQELDIPHNLIGGIRKIRNSYSVFKTFNEDTPITPSKKAQEVLSSVSKEDVETILKLYQERPIWSKSGLLTESKLSYSIVKKILLNVAYYYVNGPWKRLWIKLGYDPRKDPHSRIYQNIDYRVRNTGGFKNIIKNIVPKRTYMFCKTQKPDEINVNISDKKIEISDINEYVFKPGMIPPKKQVYYQYCDLKIPEIEEMLSKLGEVLPGSLCNERRGWMPKGFDEQCRDIINGYVIDKMRELMAENFALNKNNQDNESNSENNQLEIEYDDDDDDDDDEDDEEEVDSECDEDLDND